MIECPHCYNGELHPVTGKLLIRAYKVCTDGKTWASQCLVCSGYYDKSLNETPSNHVSTKGWF